MTYIKKNFIILLNLFFIFFSFCFQNFKKESDLHFNNFVKTERMNDNSDALYIESQQIDYIFDNFPNDRNEEITLYSDELRCLNDASNLLIRLLEQTTILYDEILKNYGSKIFPNFTYNRTKVVDSFSKEKDKTKISFLYGVGDEFFEYYFFVLDLKLSESIKFVKIYNENYWYPTLNFSVRTGQRICGLDNVLLPQGFVRETIQYDVEKINPIKNLNFFVETNPIDIIISFPNIKFNMINKSIFISNENNSIFTFTEKKLYDLFRLNGFIPENIKYKKHMLDEKAMIEVNEVYYNIITKYQKIQLRYYGQLFVEFKRIKSTINIDDILNNTNIYDDEIKILNSIKINEEDKRIISKIEIINKNYILNKMTIRFHLNEKEILDNIFLEDFSHLPQYYDFVVIYNNQYNVNVDTSLCENITKEMFTNDCIKIEFCNDNVGQILINEIKFSDKNKMQIYISINLIDKKIDTLFEIECPNFIKYSVLDLTDLTKEMFLKDNKILDKELLNFVRNRSNWNLIVNSNKTLFLDDFYLVEKQFYTSLYFTIYDNNTFSKIKEESIELPFKIFKENSKNQNESINIYLILLIICIFLILFAIFIKLLRKKK